MLNRFCESGRYEPFKTAWHGLLLLGALGAAAYNVVAWLRRRERHLAMNVGIYLSWALLEYQQIARHCEAARQGSGRRRQRRRSVP